MIGLVSDWVSQFWLTTTPWAGYADIRAAVVRRMAGLITPTSVSRDITSISTRRATGSVARSLTRCFS